MHLMTDAVAGARKVDSVLPCHRLNVAVVVRILKTGLQGVVVDVCHAPFGFHAFHAHGFEFEICHCAGCVLRQRLVDPQSDFRAPPHLSRNQMCPDDLFRYGLSHVSPPYSV